MLPEEKRRAGEVLRKRLDELNMTVTELARASGVDPTTIRAVLRGERAPTARTRAKLAEAVGWPYGKGLRLTLGGASLADVSTDELRAELASRPRKD